jgi:hypothetical protein
MAVHSLGDLHCPRWALLSDITSHGYVWVYFVGIFPSCLGMVYSDRRGCFLGNM